MANTLTLKGGAPYNIVKKGARWYFVNTLFGAEYRNLPKELLLVPEGMIPSAVNSDGETGYIPESSIVSYFKSRDFDTAFNKYKSSKAAPTATGGRQGTAYVPAQAAGKLPATSSDLANIVSSVASKYDETSRIARFESTANKTDPKTGQPSLATSKDLPAGWFGTIAGSSDVTTADAWAAANSRYAINNNYKYIASEGKVFDPTGRQELLFVPGPTGRIEALTVGVYEQGLSELTIEQRKKWQKTIGSPVVDGILKANEIAFIKDRAREASSYNFSNLRSGDKGFKPLDPLRYTFDYLKGSGGGETTTTRTVTKWNKDQARTLVENVFANTVGRRPTEQEINLYLKGFNKKAVASPTVSTTTTSGSGKSRYTVGTEGFGSEGAAYMVRSAIEMTPEARAVASSTTLFKAFLDAMKNPIG